MNTDTSSTNEIAVIWRLHKKQQALYRLAMTMDISTHLRKICSRGYISSILFKKEISFIYDHTKCYLNDGDLSSITTAIDTEHYTSDGFADLMAEIRTNQVKCIQKYRAFMTTHVFNPQIYLLLDEHVEKLAELSEMFEMAYDMPAVPKLGVVAVA